MGSTVARSVMSVTSVTSVTRDCWAGSATGLRARAKSDRRPAVTASSRRKAGSVDVVASAQKLERLVTKLRPALAGLAAAAALTVTPASTLALDSATVGACLFQNCQVELAKCIADEKCAESLVCLNRCNNRPDESDCQIRCGDLYNDEAIGAFNTCAVTQKKCVPQIPDRGEIVLPTGDALVPEFNVDDFQGRWYISSGLNKDFDIFDCQVHYFTAPGPGELYGKLNWRVKKTNGQFYERSDVQTFKQQESQAVLFNHDNEFLHYQDDWYIIAQKPDEYVFVFYRGSNDAWDGYGGSVVYTRTPSLDPKYYPELREAATRAGLDFDKFVDVDNTCGPEPTLRLTRPTDLDTLYDDLIAVQNGFSREVAIEVKEVEDEILGIEKAIERELQKEIVSFERGFTGLKKDQKSPVAKGMTKADVRAMGEKSDDIQEATELLDAMQDRMEDADAPKNVFAKFFSSFKKA